MRSTKLGLWTCIAMLFLVLFYSVAFADEGIQVTQLKSENATALLVKCGAEYLVTGSSDAAMVIRALTDQKIADVSYVVGVCDHEDHLQSLRQIGEHFGARLLVRSETIESLDIQMMWLDNGVQLSLDEGSYAFGVEQCVDGCISYKCDGTMLAFSATTNEASVNVRAETSTEAKRVAKFNRGSILTVLNTAVNDKGEIWYRVRLEDGEEGFIRSDLIRYLSEEEIKAEVQQQEKQQSETRYIGHKKNKVFHKPSCKSLPASKNQVYFSSRDYAVSKGYRPCSKCKP